MSCTVNGVSHRIGDSVTGERADFTPLQQKIFEFTNYQNFLRQLNNDKEKNYFQYPHPGRLYGKRKNSEGDYYSQQQIYLQPLLDASINERTVAIFEDDLKKFIKNFVIGKSRLLRGFKTGFTSNNNPLYNGCVIQTEDTDTFGTYDTVSKVGEIDYVSPTINLEKIVKEVEAEIKREINARYSGGTRANQRSKKNKRTTRRLRLRI